MPELFRKSVLTLFEVNLLAMFYDDCLIDGDKGKVLFFTNGKFQRSAWLS